MTVFHWVDIGELLDRNKSEFDHTPKLTCRLCRRKEKTLVHPISFFEAIKLTPFHPNNLVLDGRTTGGYPRADDAVFGVPNPVFPILDLEWRHTVAPSPLGLDFFTSGEQPFSLDTLRHTAQLGGQLILHHGELHLALRDLQERKMRDQSFFWLTMLQNGRQR